MEVTKVDSKRRERKPTNFAAQMMMIRGEMQLSEQRQAEKLKIEDEIKITSKEFNTFNGGSSGGAASTKDMILRQSQTLENRSLRTSCEED